MNHIIYYSLNISQTDQLFELLGFTQLYPHIWFDGNTIVHITNVIFDENQKLRNNHPLLGIMYPIIPDAQHLELVFHELFVLTIKPNDPKLNYLINTTKQAEKLNTVYPNYDPISGRVYEVSLLVPNLKTDLIEWESIDFIVYENEMQGERWKKINLKTAIKLQSSATLSFPNEHRVGIGIYEHGSCPHLFDAPALTFFASDMPERIEKLKAKGIVFTEEIQAQPKFGDNTPPPVTDAILKTEEGVLLFLFSC